MKWPMQQRKRWKTVQVGSLSGRSINTFEPAGCSISDAFAQRSFTEFINQSLIIATQHIDELNAVEIDSEEEPGLEGEFSSSLHALLVCECVQYSVNVRHNITYTFERCNVVVICYLISFDNDDNLVL